MVGRIPADDASLEKAAGLAIANLTWEQLQKSYRTQAFSTHDIILSLESSFERGQMVWQKGKCEEGLNMHFDVWMRRKCVERWIHGSMVW